MVGALSIVRFRSPIKNPYELVSYFYLITVGIATSVNPTISINFFIATILISLLIESGNFIGERFGLNSSINELDEFTKTNFLLLKTKKKIDEYADSRFLRNFSFSESEYTYNFSDNDNTNLEKILDQINLMPKKNIWDDGHKGFESFSPFDKIIITAACETPPNNLLKQLKIDGKMVVPIGKDVQKMTLFTRVSENKFEKRTFGDYRFVPMLRNKN